jgi:hypothetical protein
METFSYQTWFSVRYVHVVSVALLSGGAFAICALSAASAAVADPKPALMMAAVYERVFWLMAGVAVATGVSNLGLKGDGVLGPTTSWGSALSLKLTMVVFLLALSLVRSDFVVRWPMSTCPHPARARLVLIVLYGATAAMLLSALWIGLGLAHGRY